MTRNSHSLKSTDELQRKDSTQDTQISESMNILQDLARSDRECILGHLGDSPAFLVLSRRQRGQVVFMSICIPLLVPRGGGHANM